LLRWEKFIELTEKSLKSGAHFDQPFFSAWCIDFEKKWVNGEIQDCFLEKPEGNAVETTRRLLEKYKLQLLK
jgi:hypothetical protein